MIIAVNKCPQNIPENGWVWRWVYMGRSYYSVMNDVHQSQQDRGDVIDEYIINAISIN